MLILPARRSPLARAEKLKQRSTEAAMIAFWRRNDDSYLFLAVGFANNFGIFINYCYGAPWQSSC